ncbi:hypothetical protein [Sporomusa ovata]|uniref:Uncharacterized protein n=1 Tax=Sporomusa ovata TaxID=2378 RepID=A0A0U1KWR1_9FIRM|nr:hypothetical protein [Sporomusa ovata]CQR71353.1 hypothetical protein SpAn4DRAFT_3858 [Sporomusa ovata]
MAKKKYCATCGAKIAKGRSTQVYDEVHQQVVAVCEKTGCLRPFLKTMKGAKGA